MTQPNSSMELKPCRYCGEAAYLGPSHKHRRAHCRKCKASAPVDVWQSTRPAAPDGSALPEGLGLVLDTMRLALNWAETEGEKPVQMDFKSAETIYTAARLLQQAALTAAKAPSTGERPRLKRFHEKADGGMFEAEDGYWVRFNDLATPQPAPTAAEDGLREALEAKIASLEASIKGKEAIIYGLLTKGTNQ